MFAQTEKRYILQGFGGTDYQWVPESIVHFNALTGMWTLSQSIMAPLLQTPRQQKNQEKDRGKNKDAGRSLELRRLALLQSAGLRMSRV